MKRIRVLAGIMLISVLASGCDTLPTTQPAPQPQPSPHRKSVAEPSINLESIVMYFNHLRKLSGSELNREHDAARQAFASNASESNRVRLALVLSLPAAAFRDERRALELLEPMARDLRAEYTPLRGFAFVVQAFVREQNRVASNAQALKDKLDALKSLEKSLTERERAAPGGSR